MVASVSSQQSLSGDLAKAISVGGSGVSSFVTNQPEITFSYPNQFLQTLFDISVSTDTSNVRQIEVTYIASQDGSTLLTDARGNIIRDQSPANNPKITLSPPREGVYGFNVRILATNDNIIPKRVTVVANGCQKSSMHTTTAGKKCVSCFFNLGATTTTTTPNPFYNVPRTKERARSFYENFSS